MSKIARICFMAVGILVIAGSVVMGIHVVCLDLGTIYLLAPSLNIVCASIFVYGIYKGKAKTGSK